MWQNQNNDEQKILEAVMEILGAIATWQSTFVQAWVYGMSHQIKSRHLSQYRISYRGMNNDCITKQL